MSPRPSIAKLNDLLRTTFLTGRVFLTEGISNLPDGVRRDVITRVRTFDAFEPGNDPYGEHDFGSIDHPEAGRIFWKIDYYDPSMSMGSEDPADPAKTCRVLTIMLAGEY